MGRQTKHRSRQGIPPLERFYERIRLGDGCADWAGNCLPEGYGTFSVKGKVVYAHRFSCETFVGEIPAGCQIHPLCHNPWCVRPGHLQPITPEEHNPQRSHCQRGPSL